MIQDETDCRDTDAHLWTDRMPRTPAQGRTLSATPYPPPPTEFIAFDLGGISRYLRKPYQTVRKLISSRKVAAATLMTICVHRLARLP